MTVFTARVSPRWLGSDLAYMKYFGQYFHYFPLRPPQRKPLTNEYLRPRLVFATGVRVGLAKGIGGVVPMTERFFAGGSYSMRGFAQNAVGPIGPDLIPTGGNALVIFNNELRTPLFGRFDGVLFTDIGNVYPLISDITFDFRESAGVGLRVRTPWFLLRGDYGFSSWSPRYSLSWDLANETPEPEALSVSMRGPCPKWRAPRPCSSASSAINASVSKAQAVLSSEERQNSHLNGQPRDASTYTTRCAISRSS